MTIQEQLEAEQKAHKATQDKLTKAEADTKAAIERAEKAETEAGKVAKLESDGKAAADENAKLKTDNGKLAEENKKLTESNVKLAEDNKTLAAKEQDIDKRAIAKFNEHAAAIGLDPSKAPNAVKPSTPTGQGGDILAQLEAITDPCAKARFRAAHAEEIWAAGFKSK